jgi:hypothetical protein
MPQSTIAFEQFKACEKLFLAANIVGKARDQLARVVADDY